MSFEPVSFLTQLVGTLIGAGVGFALVVRWDRKKKNDEKEETKLKIINSLIEEMEKNLAGVNDYEIPTWEKNNGQFRGDFGLMATSAFQSIVNGGNFLELATSAQTSVSEIYQHAELFNKFMDDIIEFSSFGLSGENQRSVSVEEMRRRLQEQKNALQTKMPNTITELKSLRKKEE